LKEGRAQPCPSKSGTGKAGAADLVLSSEDVSGSGWPGCRDARKNLAPSVRIGAHVPLIFQASITILIVYLKFKTRTLGADKTSRFRIAARPNGA